MKFSALRKTQPLELEVQPEVYLKFELREMSGLEGGEYKNVLRSKIRSKGDETEVLDFRGLYSDLLCRCMYDQEGKLVSREVIDGWPESTQQALFEAAQKVNGLDKEADPKKD